MMAHTERKRSKHCWQWQWRRRQQSVRDAEAKGMYTEVNCESERNDMKGLDGKPWLDTNST